MADTTTFPSVLESRSMPKHEINWIILLLSIVLVSCGQSAQERQKAWDSLNADMERSTRELDAQNQSLEIQIVELEQGHLAALKLQACYLEGYKDDPAPKPPTMSNRKKAECDAIIATEKRHQARQDAEEKQKDEEWDKKHKVKP